MRMPTATITLALLVTSAGCIQGDRLAQRLEPSCAASQYPMISDVQLPTLDRPASAAGPAPMLSIEHEQIIFESSAIGSMAGPDSPQVRKGFADQMAQLRASAEHSATNPNTDLIVAAPASTAAVAMGALLRAAHAAGFRHAHLLAEPSQAPPMPAVPDPELALRLMHPDPSMRAMLMAQSISEAIWFCPDLTQMYQAIANADPSAKCPLMVEAMGEVGFPCFGSQTTLETVSDLMFRPSTYTTFVTAELDPAQPIPTSGTWAQMLEKHPGIIGVKSNAE